jgi:nucleotide-binding universal stress UspA family protein
MRTIVEAEGRAPGAGAVAAAARPRRLVKRRSIGSVLFATAGQKGQSASLQHAAALARGLNVELFVLYVRPPRWPLLAALADHFGLDRPRLAPERCLAEAKAVRMWCDDVLSSPIPAQRLRVRIGDLIGEATEYARSLAEPVIVLSPTIANPGGTATALACASSRSVLVVRPPVRTATVMVASDLEKHDADVVARAVTLGAQLGGSVIALHNVSCVGWSVPFASPALAPALPVPDADLARETRARVVERLAPLSTVVTSDIDPARAIVDQARVHRVHTIVVGTSARSRFERFLAPSVAADVVKRADRSVLVTPRVSAPGP